MSTALILCCRCFVRYCSSYGYDKVLRRAGRHFCHFLQEVDNLHAQLRFRWVAVCYKFEGKINYSI